MVQESHVLGTTNQQQQQVTSATLALPHQTGQLITQPRQIITSESKPSAFGTASHNDPIYIPFYFPKQGTGTQQQLTEQHQSDTIYGSPGGRLLLGWAAGLETFLPPISWSKQLHAALQEANNVVIEGSAKI